MRALIFIGMCVVFLIAMAIISVWFLFIVDAAMQAAGTMPDAPTREDMLDAMDRAKDTES